MNDHVATHLTRNELSQAYFYAMQAPPAVSPDACFCLARLYVQLELFRKAKQTLAPLSSEVLSADKHIELLNLQAEMCNAQHDYTAAENWRCEILNVLRENQQKGSLKWVQSLIAWGGSIAAMGDLYKAISVYQEAADTKPRRRDTWHLALRNIGCCYRNLGCFDLAEEAFDAALDVDDDPTTRTYLRDVHAARRLEVDAAVAEDRAEYWALRYELCEVAQTLVRNRFNYQTSQGNIETTTAYAHQLLQLNRPDEANRVLLSRNPAATDDIDWRLSRAIAQLALAKGDLAGASRHYDAAAKATSFRPQLACEHGSVFQLLEQHDAAYECFKSVVDTSAGAGKRAVAFAYIQMGHLNRLGQRFKGAARCYANALNLQPVNDNFAQLLADAQAAARLVKKHR